MRGCVDAWMLKYTHDISASRLLRVLIRGRSNRKSRLGGSILSARTTSGSPRPCRYVSSKESKGRQSEDSNEVMRFLDT